MGKVATSGVPIWATNSQGLDPKRGHRFILLLNGVPSYFVRTVGMPQLTVGDGGTYKFLGHEYKFPGSAKWEGDITVKLIDTIDINMSQKLADSIRKAGYVYPSQFTDSQGDPNFYRKTISKAKFDFKRIGIQRVDADGKPYETIYLQNPWISKVTFGSASYDDEKLLELEITFKYDWAELHGGPDGEGILPIQNF